MKRVFLVLFSWLLSSYILCYSQCVRGIIFADTNDPKIGNGAQVNVYNMIEFMTTVATATGYVDSPPIIVRSGGACNKQNLLSVLSNLRCDPNDIVIFAYFGHGARAVTDTSDFPQMCLGSKNESNFYPLENVRDLIMQKKPKLCIVLGDCCNSSSKGVTSKPKVVAAAASSTYITHEGEKALKKMFLDNQGSIICSGSKEGEYSWYNPMYGGYFTTVFVTVAYDYVNTNLSSYNWTELLGCVSPLVDEMVNTFVKNDGKEWHQHPIYRINTTPATRTNKKPVPTNDFRAALVRVANGASSAMQRIRESEQVLANYFASGTTLVDIVGQDGHTIVSSETAEDFLLRISTAKNLANFAILEEEKDTNGKRTYIMLHEIYLER